MFQHKGKGMCAAVTGPHRAAGMPQLLDQSRLKVAVTKDKRKLTRISLSAWHFFKCLHLRLKFPQIKIFLFYFWCSPIPSHPHPTPIPPLLAVFAKRTVTNLSNPCLWCLFTEYHRPALALSLPGSLHNRTRQAGGVLKYERGAVE